MKKLLRICIVAIGLSALSGVAQADIFMLIPGLAGDSTAKGHENWIRVSSLDWNVTAASAWTAGGPAVGKPNSKELQLVLPTGAWSSYFARLITQGKPIPKIIMDTTASDGRPLYRMTVEGFFLTDYRLASLTATPSPHDHVKGVFKIVRLEYFAISADGRLITNPVDWNVVTGVSTPSAN